MSSARDDILGRLRQRIGREPAGAPAAHARVEQVIAASQAGPRPSYDGDLAARFIERAKALISTVDECAAPADVPARCAHWLTGQGLGRQVVVSPALAGLDWAASGLDARIGAAGGDDPVGVTGCFRAIAETGTLMLCSGAQSPAVNSLLPETHIAVVQREHIVADMEAAFAVARDAFERWPRAVNFVSGPSRTADIEQTIVLGAHGPYRVHLLIVG
ncbi:lactate utilization protein C [Methyloversatilis sp.]|uniref:LutC/YkgG family protein n=1 Tax=Methyloversatilis sp. TaxID=2569862 RepID=UPI002733264F|nr:lactate utilization protein C [Methyloversatilis sp.]MDP2868083.1 lactate utilization protein C [Methyloversatilis sp.]MDP3457316.1 lactate utilization protein C [Methyloversatilis sp.]MDP3577054.1 lactate utilization protein C [Methyloversatilis sp.]